MEKFKTYLKEAYPKKDDLYELGSDEEYKMIPIVSVNRSKRNFGIEREDINGKKVIVLMDVFNIEDGGNWKGKKVWKVKNPK